MTFSFLYFSFFLSLTILPSEISTTRDEMEATFSECVTMMTSFPLSAISFNIFKICAVVVVSREPVGSSAMMILGLLISARAMATRCFCPPESWVGFFLICDSSPTSFKIFVARSTFSFSLTLESVKARVTLSKIDRCEIRLND